MSDTTRTEKFLLHIDDSEIDMGQVGDFMRDMERELNALKAERDRQAEFIACLRNVMGNILNDLPAKRDWLDPTTERIACEYVHKGDVATPPQLKELTVDGSTQG